MADRAKRHQALVPDLIARFRRLDPTGSGFIASDLFKELLRRIGFTDSVLEVVMLSAGISDAKAIRYAEFVGWLFADAALAQTLSRESPAAEGGHQQDATDEAAGPSAREVESVHACEPEPLVRKGSQSTANPEHSMSSTMEPPPEQLPSRDDSIAMLASPAPQEGVPRDQVGLVRTVTWEDDAEDAAMQSSKSSQSKIAEKKATKGFGDFGGFGGGFMDGDVADADLELLMYDLIDPYELSKAPSFKESHALASQTSQSSLKSVATGISEFWQDTSATRAGRTERLGLEMCSARKKLAAEEAELAEEEALETGQSRDSSIGGNTVKTVKTTKTGGTLAGGRSRQRGNVAEAAQFHFDSKDSMISSSPPSPEVF